MCVHLLHKGDHEIRKFHVVVVQWWQRNVRNNVLYVQSCYLSISTYFSPLSLLRGARGGAVVWALASHQSGPGSNPGIDTICGLSLLLVLSFTPTGFSGVLWFSQGLKNQHSKFQLDQESGRWRTTLWICMTCYLQIIIYLFYLFILFVAIVVGFVVIQRQCCHGNVMSHFSSLLTIN